MNLAAHASLASAVVRTAPRRLPTTGNQLASKFCSLINMGGAGLMSSCESGCSCKPGQCSCENCPKKSTDKGKSACS